VLIEGGKLMRVLKVVCCAAALTALLAPAARADEWNKKTFLTFSGPVQVPGATLPAGTYTFKLADLNGNRHVVQIFDKAEKKIFTTLMAIPNQRLEPSDKPIVLFTETPVGSPQAVKVWYYPGETIGNEFVYPKSQAITIAKASHTTVLATNDDAKYSEQMKNAEIGHIDEQGRMRGDDFPAATTTASTDAKLKNASSSAAAGTSGTAPTARRSLPRTASNLPLVGLFSALALAAGFGVRRARTRIADAA
jgi:hypothetical protein